MSNENNNPLLKDLTDEQIREAAERWIALTTLARYPMMAQRGFAEGEQPADDNRRSLTLTIELGPERSEHPGEIVQRSEAASNLTDLADLARARALEAGQS